MYSDFAAAVDVKRMTARRSIFEIRRTLPIAGTWLDVGCGDGMFVKMRHRWYFYIPEEHLQYFNRANLTRWLRQKGFEVISATRTYKPLTFNYSLTQFDDHHACALFADSRGDQTGRRNRVADFRRIRSAFLADGTDRR